MTAQADFRNQRIQGAVLLILIALISGLGWINFKISRVTRSRVSFKDQEEEPIYFQTSGNFQIRCPLKHKKHCLNVRLKELTSEKNELVYLGEEGTEFVSSLEGEVTYVRTGMGGESPETATYYPSLVIENQGKKLRYIFSGKALPDLRWVKEGETLGKLGSPIKEEGGTYNLILWVEEGGKRLKILK